MTDLEKTNLLPMFRCFRSKLHFPPPSATAPTMSTITSNWDATTSLTLNHPTLHLLEKCTSTPHFKQILAQMMRLHLTSQTFPMSRLLHFSALSHPENLDYAILLFTHFTPSPNLYIFNAMISALTPSLGQVIYFYRLMLSLGISPDEHTLLSLLKSAKGLSIGEQVFAHAIINGLSSHGYIQNSLMKMYLENGKVNLAYQLFGEMPKRDTVSYNVMISGYARKECISEAFELFRDMSMSCVEPDQYTMVELLLCCGQLKNVVLGKVVHGWITRRISIRDWGLVLTNALLDMYAKCEEMELALKVFEGVDTRDGISWNIIIAGFANIKDLDLAYRFFSETPVRDLVSWNSMLAGFARKGEFEKVIALFQDMVAQNVKPDKVTAITLACVAAEMGDLDQGKCIHSWIVKKHGHLDAFLGSALIDMYSKCGSIERSLIVFEKVSDKDVAFWTAMITGLAFHGHGTKALKFFQEMQEEGLLPNSVTLIAVLTACSHAGLVDEGYRIFKDMKQIYGIEPGIEHYGCLVDLLARSGRLNAAKDVVSKMTMKPSRSIWGAILNASKVYGDVELSEIALRELLKLQPEDDGGYVLLSNVYASYGKWNYCDRVREIMGNRGIKKQAGYSSLVVDGGVHEFVSSDKRHYRRGEIYHMLGDLQREMKSGVEVLRISEYAP